MNVAIVDDTEQDAETVRAYLRRYERERNVNFDIQIFESGDRFLEAFHCNFDLVLMDIEMPGLNGMQTARKMRKADKDVALIFFTRMMRYAIKGYEVGAVDFIVKPIDYAGFALKLKKAISAMSRRQESRIEIADNGNRVFVPVADIYYIEVMRHDCTFYTAHGEFSMRTTLASLEESLSGKGFCMCSRYCLVNLKHVLGVYDGYLLVGKTKLEISRRKKKEVMDAMLDYYGNL